MAISRRVDGWVGNDTGACVMTLGRSGGRQMARSRARLGAVKRGAGGA